MFSYDGFQSSYYSNPISNQLIVDQIETGLVCVTTFHDVYHRAFIKETDSFRCVILYVDYGTIEEVNKDQREFKYLLNHFAELPCMSLSCRLDDVFFLPHDNHWSSEAYQEIISLCQGGPYFIEHTGFRDGLLTIRILDADRQCLNDMIIESKLAVKQTSSLSSSDLLLFFPSRLFRSDYQRWNNFPSKTMRSFCLIDSFLILIFSSLFFF